MGGGKEVLVTGGAGFIGSHVVRGLLREGFGVTVMDNFLTGRRENLEGIEGEVRLLEADIRDLGRCREAVEGKFAVLHQAALPSVPRSIRDPLLTNGINVTGTLNLLVAARDAGAARFVFASSSSVYGDTEVLPKVETMSPRPLSPYAIQKLTGEHYCRIFNEQYGLGTVSLRYFNIFGPRQDPASQYAAVVPLFITAVKGGGTATIFGDGLQSRDFTYVDNVVAANILALGCDHLGGQAVNIACGTRHTVSSLLEALERLAGRTVQREHEAERPGDVRHSEAAVGAAAELLGYRPEVGFEEGLRRTLDSYW